MRARLRPGELVLWDTADRYARPSRTWQAFAGRGPDRIESLSQRLDVELDRRISDLSKGNREKIGLIQGFMHEPELVILDEPTSGLDPSVQQEVFAIVDEIKERAVDRVLQLSPSRRGRADRRSGRRDREGGWSRSTPSRG